MRRRLMAGADSSWSRFHSPRPSDCRRGYVDPEPVLQAAAAAIGVDKANCVTMTGTGYAGMVGQQRLAEKNVDWPRGEPLANYTRTMNWDARTMIEEFDRKPGLNPASWKWGLGWIGRHAAAAALAPDLRRQRQPRLAASTAPIARRSRRRRTTPSARSSRCG